MIGKLKIKWYLGIEFESGDSDEAGERVSFFYLVRVIIRLKMHK